MLKLIRKPANVTLLYPAIPPRGWRLLQLKALRCDSFQTNLLMLLMEVVGVNQADNGYEQDANASTLYEGFLAEEVS